ncbi:hypothetical protein EBU95_19990 [bacterium]|nr:hypothetical protein [bacterium]
MANVNLKSLTTVLGENSSIADIPITASDIVTCQSNQVLKINSLYVANIDGTNTATITADVHNGTRVLSWLVKGTSVGAGGTVNIVTVETPIYITEGQSVRLTASASGDLSGFVSYERIS